MNKYVDSLINQFQLYSSKIGRLSTIYFGGGTPSVLGTKLLQRLLVSIYRYFDLSVLEEFTVECNPEDVTPDLVDLLVAHGVNRVSLGVQSLDDNMLRFINRRHNSSKVFQSVSLLKSAGITNISVDFIFGLPMINDYDFSRDVSRFLSLDVKHLSAYSLSYEEGSHLTYLLNNNLVTPLDDDVVADQYAFLTSQLQCHGFHHYEISNYSLPDFHSRHNTACWHRVPYLGLGPSASSFDGLRRMTNIPDIIGYLENPLFETEVLSSKDVYNEVVMLGLRTAEGVNLSSLPHGYSDSFLSKANTLTADGLLVKTSIGYSIPEDKWFILDAITESLLD